MTIRGDGGADWPMTTLASAGKWGSGGTPRRGTPGYYGGHIPWLKIGDLNDGTVVGSEERITVRALKESSAKLVPAGTLLVAMYGSIGKLGIAGSEVATNQAIAHCIVDNERFETDFVFFYLLSERANLLAEGKGGTQTNISQTVLKAYPLPEPSPEEQKRIVGRLKAALAEVRQARAVLERVPAQVKRLKQSILASAFRGELTAEWRTQNAHRFQHDDPGGDPEWLTADLLLARILKARRARWGADQSAKMSNRGQIPNGAKWKPPYAPPTAPDTNDLDELPEDWAWASLDSQSVAITSGSRDWKRYYNDSGPGVFVMAQNVRPMRYDPSFRLSVDPPPGDRDRSRSEIRQGDLLVTIVGANTGDACSMPFEPEQHFVCQSVALIRPALPELTGYLEMHLNAPWPTLTQWREWIYGEGRPHLSFDHLRRTAIALPSVAEQNEIIRQIGTFFHEADTAQQQATGAITKLKSLEQSILQSAFRGEL